MRDRAEIYADKRLEIDKRFPLAVNPKTGAFGGSGWVKVQKNKSAKWADVIWGSDEDGLEHVSVKFKDRCLTWEEMCVVKDIFWKEEEQCIQVHPKKSEYINISDTCLHIWRKKDAPDSWPFSEQSQEQKTGQDASRTEPENSEDL